MAYIREEVRVASGINLLIGLWLILAPFFVWYTELQGATWNSVLIGSALVLLSLAEMVRPMRLRNLRWINFALGVWLFFAPFLLGFHTSLSPSLIHLGMGAMVAALSLGSILASRTTEA